MQIVQVVRARARQTCLKREPGCDTFALRAGKLLARIMRNCMGRRCCMCSTSVLSFMQIVQVVRARARQTCLYREPATGGFFGVCTTFGCTSTKIGTIQRRLAWPLRKDDTQIREAFHIFPSLTWHGVRYREDWLASMEIPASHSRSRLAWPLRKNDPTCSNMAVSFYMT